MGFTSRCYPNLVEATLLMNIVNATQACCIFQIIPVKEINEIFVDDFFFNYK